MLQLNENYSNSTPIAVLGTVQSSEMDYKKISSKMFAHFKSMFTFVVRQSYLHNSYVDFLYPYGTYFKIYRRSYTRVFICRIAVKRLSQTRVCFSFFIYQQINSFHATTE